MLLAALVQYSLLPEPAIAPFVFFFFSIAVVSWLAGLGPGFLAVLLSAVVANWLFMAPYRQFNVTRQALTVMLLFLVGASPVAFLCAGLRDALVKAQRTASRLRESEQRLAAIVERAPAFMCVLRGPEFVFELANERYLQLVGRRDIVGAKLLEALPEIAGTTYPKLLEQVYSTGEPFTSGEASLKLARGPGGRLEEAWLEFVYLPMREADGSISGILVHGVEITERKRSEQRLRESEQRFRTLADNMAQLAWMADEKGWIFWYNQRWFDYTGTTFEDVEGWGWQKVHHPENVPRVVEKIRRSFETGEPWEDTFPLRRKDGTYRWFLSRMLPIRDEEGRVVRWFGTSTDVTEQRDAELSLREADRRKTDFLAMLSHELRNPLTPILNALWLLNRSHSSDDASRAKEVISRQALHLTRIVDDLLDITRISRGTIQLRKERLNLVDVVRRSIEDHESLFATRDVSIDFRRETLPIPVNGDATRLGQAIANVLWNAAKFTSPGGHVSVAVEREGESTAAVRIRDDGIGIPASTLPHVFEPFVQADTSLDRTRGGLGLGLSLVKGLVELHNGTVQAQSEGPGRGAEFVLRLPIAPETPALATVARTAQQTIPHHRVLVVEDNVDAAETLRDMLLVWGQEVEVAYDGREGVEKARAFRPNVVLCDIGLPVMDGYAVARALRADPAFQEAFLVAVTGYASPEDERKAVAAGFDRHLGKPVPVDLVEQVLASAPRRLQARA